MFTSSFLRCRPRLGVAPALAMILMVGAAACDDTEEPDDTVVDELKSEGDVPFDNDVPPGVGTETDERDNQGFETDELGPVGNETDPNG